MGKGDRRSRKGKIRKGTYGKYRVKKRKSVLRRKIKVIQNRNKVELDWNERMQFLNEYLKNGGLEKIYNPDSLRGILEIKFDPEGKVIVDSIPFYVKSATKALHLSQFEEPVVSKGQVHSFQSLLQKEILFDQINVTSQEEFDILYDYYSARNRYLYRGVNEAKYRLNSRLQRFWIDNKLGDRNVSYIDFVKNLIQTASSSIDLKRHFDKNQIDLSNEIAVLCFLQHYGCPTPLLDWTSSFRVATFFAFDGVGPSGVQRRIDRYVSIYLTEERHIIEGSLKNLIRWSLNQLSGETKSAMVRKAVQLGLNEDVANRALTPKAVERVALHSYGQRFLDEVLLKLEYIFKHPILYFTDYDNFDYQISFSLRNNPNVINQKGVFFWNSSPDQPLDHVASEVAKDEGASSAYIFCKCINIDKDLKGYIVSRLSKGGIDRKFIYPERSKSDFESLASSVFENVVKRFRLLE